MTLINRSRGFFSASSSSVPLQSPRTCRRYALVPLCFLELADIHCLILTTFVLQILAIEAALLSQSAINLSVAQRTRKVPSWVQWLPPCYSACCVVASLALALYTVLSTVSRIPKNNNLRTQICLRTSQADQWQGIVLVVLNVVGELVNSIVGMAVLSPNEQCVRHINPRCLCPLCWWKAIRKKPEAVAAIASRPLYIAFHSLKPVMWLTAIGQSRYLHCGPQDI